MSVKRAAARFAAVLLRKPAVSLRNMQQCSNIQVNKTAL
jgi:hypothetical protein